MTKMKTTKNLLTIIIIITSILILSSCSYSDNDSSKFGGGELLDSEKMEEIKSVIFSSEEITEEESTESPTEITSDTETTKEAIFETTINETVSEEKESQEGTIVYWVEKGQVWHTSKSCSYISNKDNVISGTQEQALEAGKERVCSRCGK